MRSVGPQYLASIFQPVVQRFKITEGWSDLPQAVARITNVLLNLTFLSSSSWIAELQLKEIVARHC